jgi:hypothetical protein
VSAKALILRPVTAADAAWCCRRWHVSRTHVRNSALHFGCYWRGELAGTLSFGPSLDKRKLIGLVGGTGWHEFIELNRLAFSDALPRNSESRALAVACRLLRTHAPQVKWIVSFADATRSGHGTIYQAAGWLLTGVRRNATIWTLGGEQFADVRFKNVRDQAALLNRITRTKGKHIAATGGASMRPLIDAGARPLPGFQCRYVTFLDESWRGRLTVPVLDYAEIDRVGARMYLGRRKEQDPVSPIGLEGATPIPPLRHLEVARG